MSQVIANHDVLTLSEAAEFLRVPTSSAEEMAEKGSLPGRCLRGEWRFLKSALEDWLRAPLPNQALLAQAGALKDDESLPAILAQIYRERGRPETDVATDN